MWIVGFGNKNEIQTCSVRGFTRIDASFIVIALLLLAAVAWAWNWASGENRRIWVCAHHMKALGCAFAEYAQEHNGTLPPAYFNDGQISNSWDMEIAPYLETQSARQNPTIGQRDLRDEITYFYKCPSDITPRRHGAPRSYSMPMYDINMFGWPPTINSMGGVGLYVDAKILRNFQRTGSSDLAPAIKISMVPSPADTALLVECINNQNVLWNPNFACISSSEEQFNGKTMKFKDFHNTKMNHLMLDGHVELLSSQSLALLPDQNSDHPNIWAIKGDN
jgi:prepilin-type processing-associated H-X9-DG protein